MNPETILGELTVDDLLQVYFNQISELYTSQDIRANNYDLVIPSHEITMLRNKLTTEIETRFKTERMNELSTADNKIGEKLNKEWLKFRDARIKELADERNHIREISPFRQ